jgi:DNA-binding transcriptional ArsR family regulator
VNVANSLITNRDRPAVCVLEDAEKIELIADFERSEILRLMDERPMTETQLSDAFGITKASIGYHLNLLMEGGLIEIVKTEEEEHGIMQKYYASKAAIFIPDFDRATEQVRKQIIYSKKEWLRGALSAFRLRGGGNKHRLQIDSDTMEELTTDALRKLTDIGREYEKEITSDDRELILSRIYCRTLADLIRDPKWNGHFNEILKTGVTGMKKVRRRR